MCTYILLKKKIPNSSGAYAPNTMNVDPPMESSLTQISRLKGLLFLFNI